MKYKIIFFIIILISGCKSMSKSALQDFNIKDAYYQSWVINEKGIDIVIELKNVIPGLEFQSIIFRGLELPISIKKENNTTYLKAAYTIGLSKLDYKKTPSSKENQLIYQIDKIKKTVLLKEIRRKKTKFY